VVPKSVCRAEAGGCRDLFDQHIDSFQQTPRLMNASLDLFAGRCAGSGSQLTRRWREVDSNCWRKRDSNHRSRLVAEILQRAAEIDRKFELKIIRCTVAKQVMAAVASGTHWRKGHSLGRGYKQASPVFKFTALPAKGRGSNPWSAQLRAQLSRPAAGSPARHRDAAVRAAFSCSACHSMEPTAPVLAMTDGWPSGSVSNRRTAALTTPCR
jgi:hypothetical protein